MINLSSIFLIIANLYPLYGVLFAGWSLPAVMLLYWMESGVIGFFNIVKMSLATGTIQNNLVINGKLAASVSKFFLIPFFIFHYGIFMFVHGIFLVTLFGILSVSLNTVGLALLSLFISHGLSFLVNFLGKDEYKEFSPPQLMIQPYKRIFIMQFTIIFGGMLIMSLGTPVGALVLMVVFKIIVDLWSHFKEHQVIVKSSGIQAAA